MQIAGISHRSPTSAELARVGVLEQWLSDRGTGLDLPHAYVHAKTVRAESGSLEMHLPLLEEDELALVVDLDARADTISLHWSVETDGPTWPMWTAGEWPWANWQSALDKELRRRLRVTASRWGSAKRMELEADAGGWFVLQAGSLVGASRAREFAIAPSA